MQVFLPPIVTIANRIQTYSPDGNGGGYFDSVPRQSAGLPSALRDIIRGADYLYTSGRKKADEDYAEAVSVQQITLDLEIEAKRALIESENNGALDPAAITLRVLPSLIEEKVQRYQSQTVIALSYHGSDPLLNDFKIPEGVDALGYHDAVQRWNVAYAAALQAHLLNEQVNLLNAKMAEQEAQEAARLAAEQEAQEAARLAAEQQAQEAARLAAEQAAKAQLVNTYSHSISANASLSLARVGGAQLGLSAASSVILQASIRTAVIGIASGGAVLAVVASPVVLAGLVVGVIALSVPNSLGNSDRPISASIPVSDLIPIDGVDLHAIGAAGGVVELPYTVVMDKIGHKARVSVVKADGVVVPLAARVIPVQFDVQRNAYTVTLDKPARTFLFTPVTAPGGDALAPIPSPGDPVKGPSYEGVTLEPVITEADRLPAHNLDGRESIVLTFPIDSGLPPLLLVFSSPYGDTDTVGVYSGREYHSDKAGGPIVSLSWQDATITAEGIELVNIHTARFGASADNTVMIARLKMILSGVLEITDIDKRYYTHEIRELERYRVQGVADSEMPASDSGIWNGAHSAALEDYKLSDNATLFYTTDAIEANRAQLIEEFGL